MENTNANEYRLQDFYTSCVLLASGEKILRLEKGGNGKFTIFVFDTPEDIAQKTIQSHWNKTLRIPSRDIIEAINELKTRLHNGI